MGRMGLMGQIGRIGRIFLSRKGAKTQTMITLGRVIMAVMLMIVTIMSMAPVVNALHGAAMASVFNAMLVLNGTYSLYDPIYGIYPAINGLYRIEVSPTTNALFVGMNSIYGFYTIPPYKDYTIKNVTPDTMEYGGYQLLADGQWKGNPAALINISPPFSGCFVDGLQTGTLASMATTTYRVYVAQSVYTEPGMSMGQLDVVDWSDNETTDNGDPIIRTATRSIGLLTL